MGPVRPVSPHVGGLGDLTASMRVVVLYGKETFFIRDATRRLVEVLEAVHGEIERFDLDGVEAQLSDVLDELRSYALIRHHKLIVVDDAEKFLAAGDGRRRAMEAYAANPSPESTLLLRAQSWPRGKLDAHVKKVGVILKCDVLSDLDAVKWCLCECPARTGCPIERPAAQRLVERVGPALGRLETELGKLGAFVGEAAVITRDDVDELVAGSRQEQAWVLQGAILSGAPAVAWAQLRELLEVSRVPEQLCMWAISDLLRRLHTAARLLGRGVSAGEVSRRLRLFGAVGNRVIEVARRGDPLRLAQLLERAVQTDVAGKSGLGRTARNLEALTLQVTDTIGRS